jgi:hypothetical protein
MKTATFPLMTLMMISPLWGESSIEKELAELRQMSQQILKRIEKLEERQRSESPAVQPTPIAQNGVDSVHPYHVPKGVVELSSNDTTMTLGGRIEFNACLSDPDTPFDATYLRDVPGEGGQLGGNARDSRLWFKTQTPTELGILRSLIEIDFWGASGNEKNTNSHAPRLRYAYATLGGLTIGQANSLFTTVYSPYLIIDPVNEVYARQPLVSWGGGDDALRYDFSLEQPETTLVDYTGGQVLPGDDRFPDVAARLQYYGSWGDVAGSVIFRQIRQDHATVNGTALGNSDEAFGWGINLSAKIEVAERDDLIVGFQYGNALGRYFAEGAYNAGSIDAAGDIRLHEAYGANIAYRHWWSDTLHSTAAYNRSEVDNNLDVVPSTVSKKAYSAHLNLIWTPILNALVGFEYARLYRENVLGEHNDPEQYKIRFRYDF